jgi:uncharacterized membrane protein YeaQ/YmgE (transglycosylase-associated protein family)
MAKEPGINSFIWVAVGAVIGALSGVLMGSGTKVLRIEEVVVGVFGSFIGGEFVAAMLNDGKTPEGFTVTALLTSVAGAVVMLVLLRTMRAAVGPLRSKKSPATRRR